MDRHSHSTECTIAANAGYTIIEVLIALAIFSIGIMAMGALQSASLMSTGDIARRTEAWTFLDEQAEILKTLPFYATVAGLDYDDSGATDTITAHPALLTIGTHNDVTPDGRYSINWLVEDDQPIDLQDAADLPFSGLPAGDYTVSKTITVWVTRAGTNAQADALAIAQFVKTWVADGVSS